MRPQYRTALANISFLYKGHVKLEDDNRHKELTQFKSKLKPIGKTCSSMYYLANTLGLMRMRMRQTALYLFFSDVTTTFISDEPRTILRALGSDRMAIVQEKLWHRQVVRNEGRRTSKTFELGHMDVIGGEKENFADEASLQLLK